MLAIMFSKEIFILGMVANMLMILLKIESLIPLSFSYSIKTNLIVIIICIIVICIKKLKNNKTYDS